MNLRISKLLYFLILLTIFAMVITGCRNKNFTYNGISAQTNPWIGISSGDLLLQGRYYSPTYDNGTPINIAVADSSEIVADDIPAGFVPNTRTTVGDIYKISPLDITLKTPAEMVFKYKNDPKAPQTDIEYLRVFRYTGTKWEIVDTVLDIDNDQLTFTTIHTGIYKLAIDPASKALVVKLSLPASDPNVTDATALNWDLNDLAINQAGFKWDIAIFETTKDTSKITGLLKQDLIVKNGSISDISRTHTLKYGTQYYWGVRAIGDNAISPWAKRIFTYVKAPVLTDPFVCNVTDIGATIIWRTDVNCTNSKVYYAFDGLKADLNSFSVSEDNTMSTPLMHIAVLDWSGTTHNKVDFIMVSEDAAVSKIIGKSDNSGNNHIFTVGAAEQPPNAPEFIIAQTSGLSDNTIITGRFDLSGQKSFYFMNKVSGDKIMISNNDNRWNDATSAIINQTLDTINLVDVVIQDPAGAKAIDKVYDVTDNNGVFVIDTAITNPVNP